MNLGFFCSICIITELHDGEECIESRDVIVVLFFFSGCIYIRRVSSSILLMFLGKHT